MHHRQQKWLRFFFFRLFGEGLKFQAMRGWETSAAPPPLLALREERNELRYNVLLRQGL